MSKRAFTWSASNDNSLRPVEPHTKARHLITEDYVKNWVITLCGNNIGQSKKIVIVDGFCGGGGYVDPENNSVWDGSPIRLIKAVEAGLLAVKTTKGKPNYKLDAKFIFVDCNKNHVQSLKEKMIANGLSKYVSDPNKCVFICNEFENAVPKILSDIKSRKCSSLFVLDPTGYSDVSMKTFRKIISLSKSEILFTFMTEFMVRFLSERNGKLSNAFNDVLESDSYYDKVCLDSLDKRGQEGYIRNETLRLFRDRCKAKFVYSFALLSSGFRAKYYLVHLASSPTAQRVIKETLWKYNNIDFFYQFKFEVYGLGFRSPEYYDNNLKIFNIHEHNTSASISHLDDSLSPLIHSSKKGIQFGALHEGTMQKNPSTLNHYEQYVNEQRVRGDIEVLRNGKLTKAKSLKSSDILIRPCQPSLFDMKQYV